MNSHIRTQAELTWMTYSGVIGEERRTVPGMTSRAWVTNHSGTASLTTTRSAATDGQSLSHRACWIV